HDVRDRRRRRAREGEGGRVRQLGDGEGARGDDAAALEDAGAEVRGGAADAVEALAGRGGAPRLVELVEGDGVLEDGGGPEAGLYGHGAHGAPGADPMATRASLAGEDPHPAAVGALAVAPGAREVPVGLDRERGLALGAVHRRSPVAVEGVAL